MDRKPLSKAPEKRRPRTFWLTDSEFNRVQTLVRARDDQAIGRKALMLGLSMLESGVSPQASVAGWR